jgi:hypothetical protein
MLVLNVPHPTVTARIFVFLLTRAYFFVTPLAKGAIQLGCCIYGDVIDRGDICKWVFHIHD